MWMPSNALTLITIPETKAFLLDQRQKGQPGFMGAADMVQTLLEQRAQQRLDGEFERFQRTATRCRSINE